MLLASAAPPAVSAAVVASDVAASARAVGLIVRTLRMPVFTTDIYIGREDSAQALSPKDLSGVSTVRQRECLTDLAPFPGHLDHPPVFRNGLLRVCGCFWKEK